MFSVAAFAQRITVNGKVADGNGEPLIGVNVSVKGTTIGIITDVDGNYTLQVPANGRYFTADRCGLFFRRNS